MNLLNGIEILDFTSRLPGPLAGYILSDLGANVTKIESRLKPDPFSESHLQFVSPAFNDWYQQLNQNKSLIQCEFDDPQLHERVNKADLIVIPKNKFFLDWIKYLKPKVVLQIAAGEKEFSSLHDLNALALTSTFNLHLQENQSPPYLPIAGLSFGSHIATTALACLLKFQQTKLPLTQTVTLKETVELIFEAFKSESFEHSPKQLHNGALPCYNIYQSKDHKFLCLAAVEEKYWKLFCEIFNLDLTMEDRFNKSEEIFEKIRKKFASITANEISNIIEDKQVCLTFVK
ncbi:MAG: hypothetical protein CME62_17355 [Halobacteriovoraceae bacterium]|nr:hypothetical protein [Halobacteriovoraceae bacterium]|tara:strand:+ start:10093 stop:10959 length:867 start_codon:yes stop_codon:yes gene_type:complete